MSQEQQRTTMEWLVSAATVAALALSSWSLYSTHQHANRITALETRQDDQAKRTDEHYKTLISHQEQTRVEIRELTKEIRSIYRNRQ